MDFYNQNTICMIYVQQLVIIKLFTNYGTISLTNKNARSITLSASPKDVLKLLTKVSTFRTAFGNGMGAATLFLRVIN